MEHEDRAIDKTNVNPNQSVVRERVDAVKWLNIPEEHWERVVQWIEIRQFPVAFYSHLDNELNE